MRGKNQAKMKYVANGISILRIFMSLSLLVVELLSWGFILIYLLCGISDVLDGSIARRTKTQSLLGAKLDTAADIIMFAVIIYSFAPIVTLSKIMIMWLLAIVLIRIMSLLIIYFKYKMFAILHTYSNKITGLLLFFIPIMIGSTLESASLYFVCAIASVSAIEELVINSLSRKMEVNIKSILKL